MIFVFNDIMRKARLCSSLLALGVVVGLFCTPAAFAQSAYELSNKIKRLENEVETLSRAVYRGEAPPPGAAGTGAAVGADAEIRLQQIERELRDLRGMLEERDHEVRQLRDELKRITSDLELRVNDLEGSGVSGGSMGGAVSSSNGGSSRYTTDPAPDSNAVARGQDEYSWSSNANKPGTLGSYSTNANDGRVSGGGDDATVMYENAFSLLKNRQYAGAEGEFKRFLERYADHALAGNAKYWLGETYYVRGKFADAARVFAEGYKQYPKGSKAADNLLKLGMSLAGLGKTDDACIALDQLGKQNLAGSGPVKRRAEQERERLGC